LEEDKVMEQHFCGSKDIAKGHKGGKHCWGGRIVIHRSASRNITSHRGAGDGKSTTKGDGEGEVWIENCNEKKMCNIK
jgi:hypothetical protein